MPGSFELNFICNQNKTRSIYFLDKFYSASVPSCHFFSYSNCPIFIVILFIKGSKMQLIKNKMSSTNKDYLPIYLV